MSTYERVPRDLFHNSLLFLSCFAFTKQSDWSSKFHIFETAFCKPCVLFCHSYIDPRVMKIGIGESRCHGIFSQARTLGLCSRFLTITPKKAVNCTGAKRGLFETLSGKISQLLSPLTSLGHCGYFLEFWTRLTLPVLTMRLVSFVGFQENAFLTQKCWNEASASKTPQT